MMAVESDKPIEIKQPNVVVVEGREEEVFFGAIIKHLGLQNIQVIELGGKTNFRARLKALSLVFRERVVSLTVVRDANANPDAAFQSVQDALKAAKLPVPERPFVPVGERPWVAVMILPEEGAPGMLEDLCLRAVVQDPAMHCVKQYFECLQQEKLTLPANMSKAKVQVFLASRQKAGLRLGEAAEASYWPWDAKAFEQVRDFLRQLGG